MHLTSGGHLLLPSLGQKHRRQSCYSEAAPARRPVSAGNWATISFEPLPSLELLKPAAVATHFGALAAAWLRNISLSMPRNDRFHLGSIGVAAVPPRLGARELGAAAPPALVGPAVLLSPFPLPMLFLVRVQTVHPATPP
jgi:hypothetical protein